MGFYDIYTYIYILRCLVSRKVMKSPWNQHKTSLDFALQQGRTVLAWLIFIASHKYVFGWLWFILWLDMVLFEAVSVCVSVLASGNSFWMPLEGPLMVSFSKTSPAVLGTSIWSLGIPQAASWPKKRFVEWDRGRIHHHDSLVQKSSVSWKLGWLSNDENQPKITTKTLENVWIQSSLHLENQTKFQHRIPLEGENTSKQPTPQKTSKHIPRGLHLAVSSAWPRPTSPWRQSKRKWVCRGKRDKTGEHRIFF